eukprot:1160459-Pelagomonas_calceolata.AAC.2
MDSCFGRARRLTISGSGCYRCTGAEQAAGRSVRSPGGQRWCWRANSHVRCAGAEQAAGRSGRSPGGQGSPSVTAAPAAAGAGAEQAVGSSGGRPGPGGAGEPAGSSAAGGDCDPWEPAPAGARDVLAAAQGRQGGGPRGGAGALGGGGSRHAAAASTGSNGAGPKPHVPPYAHPSMPGLHGVGASEAGGGGGGADGWEEGVREAEAMECQHLGQPAVALNQGPGATSRGSEPRKVRCASGSVTRAASQQVQQGQAYKAIPFRHSMSVQCPIGWGTGLAWQVHKTALFLHSVFHLLASAIGRGAAGPDPMPLFKPVTGAWADEDESDGMEALEGGHGCMSPDWMQVRSYR